MQLLLGPIIILVGQLMVHYRTLLLILVLFAFHIHADCAVVNDCQLLSASKLIDSLIFTARCYASAVLAMGLCLCLSVSVCVCLSVCLSQVRVLLKRLNVGSHKQHRTIAQGL